MERRSGGVVRCHACDTGCRRTISEGTNRCEECEQGGRGEGQAGPSRSGTPCWVCHRRSPVRPCGSRQLKAKYAPVPGKLRPTHATSHQGVRPTASQRGERAFEHTTQAS